MAIFVVPTFPKFIGRIETVEEVPGEYGQQNKITLQPANPAATNMSTLFFPNTESKNGKWMKFLDSLYAARTKVVEGSVPATTVDELLSILIGAWIEVEDRVGGVVRSTGKEWTLKIVSRFFATEEEAMNVWRAEHPSAEPVVPETPMPEVSAAPAVPQVPVVLPAITYSPNVIEWIKGEYEKAGKPPISVFAEMRKNLGFSLEQLTVLLGQ